MTYDYRFAGQTEMTFPSIVEQVPELDADGQPVTDAHGEPVLAYRTLTLQPGDTHSSAEPIASSYLEPANKAAQDAAERDEDGTEPALVPARPAPDDSADGVELTEPALAAG